MRQKSVQVRTTLSVKECAALFQEEASARMRRIGSKLGEFAAKVTGNDQSGFFTPNDSSPFSALDDDKPDFAVGVLIPKFNAGARGNTSALHMYVWDRGAFREVDLVSPHDFGGGTSASRLIAYVANAFRTVDPESMITAG